jgi:hypothetical protein
MHAPQSSCRDGEIAAGLTQMIRHCHKCGYLMEEVIITLFLQKMLCHEESDAYRFY